MKTVYVVPYSKEFAGISSGDRIEFEQLGSITIGTVRRYPTLPELFEAEGFANVVPEAEDEAHALDLLRGSPEWNARAETEAGVYALRVRWTKRKS